MPDAVAAPIPAKPPVYYPVEFRGSGQEYFRIWIVNLALTLVTLGIFSAWAKVRTRRYLYGNTYIAGHAFDYHADPVRILIGRAIAVALFIGYEVSAAISPFLAIPWLAIFWFGIPWLIVTSQRFNARNTSYRNVRFNFTGTYGGAFKAFILWPIAAGATLGGLLPLAHRARDYYFIDNHTFGGKHFDTMFEGWSIYRIYLIGLLLLVLGILLVMGGGVVVGIVAAGMGIAGGAAHAAAAPPPRGMVIVMGVIFGAFAVIVWTCVATYVGTNVFNLAVSNTALDHRHTLKADLSPLPLIGIVLSNLLLLLLTVGMFYPWARVRIAQYMAEHMGVYATTDLDEFTSEVFGTQSAIGEEIAGFFDFDIGL